MMKNKRIFLSSNNNWGLGSYLIRIPSSMLIALTLTSCANIMEKLNIGQSHSSEMSINDTTSNANITFTASAVIDFEPILRPVAIYPQPILKPINVATLIKSKNAHSNVITGKKISSVQKTNDAELLGFTNDSFPTPVIRPFKVAQRIDKPITLKPIGVVKKELYKDSNNMQIANTKNIINMPWLSKDTSKIKVDIAAIEQNDILYRIKINKITNNLPSSNSIPTDKIDTQIRNNELASNEKLNQPILNKKYNSTKTINNEIKFLMGKLEKEEFYSALTNDNHNIENNKQNEENKEIDLAVVKKDKELNNKPKEAMFLTEHTNIKPVVPNLLANNDEVKEGVWHFPKSIDNTQDNIQKEYKNVTALLSTISSTTESINAADPREQDELIQSLSRKVFLLEREKEALMAKIKSGNKN